MGTGIKHEDGDYDIYVGIRFDIIKIKEQISELYQCMSVFGG